MSYTTGTGRRATRTTSRHRMYIHVYIHIYVIYDRYGATCDAHHITAPHPEGRGLAQAISMALITGDVAPDTVCVCVCVCVLYHTHTHTHTHTHNQVDYINAHGTSTPYNDKFETMAIKKALGDHAYKVEPPAFLTTV